LNSIQIVSTWELYSHTVPVNGHKCPSLSSRLSHNLARHGLFFGAPNDSALFLYTNYKCLKVPFIGSCSHATSSLLFAMPKKIIEEKKPVHCPSCGVGPFPGGNRSRSFATHFAKCKGPLLRRRSERVRVNTSTEGSIPTKPSPTNVQTSKRAQSSEDGIPQGSIDTERFLKDALYRQSLVASLKKGADYHRQHKSKLGHKEPPDQGPFQFPSEDTWEPEDNINIPLQPNQDHPEVPLSKAPYNKGLLLPNRVCFQIDLLSVFEKHRSDMKLHDEVIDIINKYAANGTIGPNMVDLQTRKSFINDMEDAFKSNELKPKHVDVQLSDGTLATISLFDLEFMILSLLNDDNLMHQSNIAEGYDLFTGRSENDHPNNDKYSEVHTGDAWKPALERFCGTNGEYMPLALIVFGDKTHTDLHGALSVTPIIFTLTCFNKDA
jgi:hypothetical protein